ncbi:MAG TPA: hypothetical protein VGF55_01340 [Gemmataceae bacterium]
MSRVFRAGHLYLVPLGRGDDVGTVRECGHCRTRICCDERHDKGFVPVKDAVGLTVTELARLTNGTPAIPTDGGS